MPTDGLPESLLSAGGGLSEQLFQLCEELLDGVQVRRVGWQIQQARVRCLDRFLHAGVSTNMTRRYGWAPKGERLVDAVPHGHWKITTIVAGLTASGVVAPFVSDGPMDGDAFRIYVEEVLAPELKPGQAVLMGNLSIHKVKGVKEAIQAAGASLLYLPSYSPDLNPIEQFFAKLKELLRKAAARTKEALWEAIGRHLDEFTAEECQNYLAHSGYEP